MNATFRFLACAVLAASAARAEPPPAVQVVVLDNENLLEGEVTRVENGYQVRRPVGGDVTLPAKRVLAVVADRRLAFDVVAARANRKDADERLRLANWCLANRLMPEALAEARAAARMRDGFAPAERLVKSLESMEKASGSPAAVVPARAEAPANAAVADVTPVDYNSESFPLFATKVNAILVNACATCHAAPESKAFKLTRAGGRSGVSQNLMAALPHVNPADPLKSPLLVNAVTPHATGTSAPLRSRAHPAYAVLETWVQYARSPEGTGQPEPTPAEPRKLPDLEAKGDAFGQDSKSEPPKPAKSADDDPFDPALFNRKK